MNNTIFRMVNDLFADLEMNEDLAAMYDELLANCKERYEDMINNGMSEVEATAAVRDSLEGMRKLLEDRPRKQPSPEPDLGGRPNETAGESADSADDSMRENTPVTIPADSLESISARFTWQDVQIGPSPDAGLHLRWEGTTDPGLRWTVRAGRLEITADPNAAASAAAETPDPRVFGPDKDQGVGLENLISGLGRILKKYAPVVLGGNCTVFLSVPPTLRPEIEIQCASGNAEIRQIGARTVRIQTASGDVTIRDVQGAMTCRIGSASGDVNAELDADQLSIKTMSGEIRFHGSALHSELDSVSGDLELYFERPASEIYIKTVSGDVDGRLKSSFKTFGFETTSGDLELRVPDGIPAIRTEVKTLTGDRHFSVRETNDPAAPMVYLKSVSGDFTIAN